MFPRLALATAFAATGLFAQSNYPPQMPEARTEIYKSVDGIDLQAWIFEPDGHSASDRRPAIVFFFGGGWRSGTPAQFHEHSKYLASRHMVAIAADYRVQTRHGVTANQCVEDAKAAVRWIRSNALRLGVDPDRIAAGGGSAGGHLAAATATLPQHDDPAGDKSVSSLPNAMVLFNPSVVRAPIPGKFGGLEGRFDPFADRMGADPRSMSPYHHVHGGTSPAILFHGTADTTVDYRTVELFCEKMLALGNRCRLVGYEGQKHGFFNHGRGDGQAYYDTVRKMDEFLVSLGWLKGPPTIRPSE